MFVSIGYSVNHFYIRLGEFSSFVFLLARMLWKRRLRMHLVIEQMVYTGVNSIPIVFVTSVFVGMAFTVQIIREFLRFGAGDMVGGIVAIAFWRELGPMMTGAVVSGRVGAAIAAELGTMKVTEQVEALEALSQNPVSYLALPRVIALTIMMPLLIGFSDIIGFLSGFVVSVVSGRINPYSYFHAAQTMLGLTDIWTGLIKGVFFGLVISLIGSYKGLRATSGAKGVGKVTRGSVVACLVSVFVLNYFLSLVIQ